MSFFLNKPSCNWCSTSGRIWEESRRISHPRSSMGHAAASAFLFLEPKDSRQLWDPKRTAEQCIPTMIPWDSRRWNIFFEPYIWGLGPYNVTNYVFSRFCGDAMNFGTWLGYMDVLLSFFFNGTLMGINGHSALVFEFKSAEYKQNVTLGFPLI